MNKIKSKTVWPKPITVSQAKRIIDRQLNHESPILDALLASGSKQALREIVKEANAPAQVEVMENHNINNFDKILENYQFESNNFDRQSCSFLRYKKNPQTQNNSSKVISANRKIRYSEIKSSNLSQQKSNLSLQNPESKLNRSRIVTMPSQLKSMKQQLLQLPIISKSNKKITQSQQNSLRRYNRLLTQQVYDVNLGTQQENQRYEPVTYEKQEDVIARYSPVKSLLSSIKRQKSATSENNSITPIINSKGPFIKPTKARKSISQNAKKIIDIMDKGKKVVNIKAARTTLRHELKKLLNAGQRLSNFMKFQNYPSERAMKLMNQATKIEKSQEKSIEQQTKDIKNNNNLGEKYKMMMMWQKDRYKSNVRQYTQMKKRHKINLIKIEAIAQLGKKKQGLKKQKLDNIVLSAKKNSPNIKNDFEEEGKKINCSLCASKQEF